MTRRPDAIDRDWVRRSMSGPISAVHPLFHRDGALDFDGLRREIDHNIAAGSGVQLLTYGDSLHSLLSDREIGEVLKVVVEHTAKRAMVVAADRAWATVREVEFADFALEAGADVLMVLPPNWAGSPTHDTYVAHYKAVSEHIPVMLVTAPFFAAQATGLRVIRTLRDTVPNVVAIKDDVIGEFARKMALSVHDHWAVLSGGQKQNHLDVAPYGCDGYMSTYLHFMPDVPHAYWRAYQAGDFTACARIIGVYDHPWFEMSEVEVGTFDAMFHATQEIFGIGGRWRRNPYHSYTDEQMERLRAFYQGLPKIETVVPKYASAPSAAGSAGSASR
jgi:dihydrodipicolinate synthase/N-acetylneuraminate lyase